MRIGLTYDLRPDYLAMGYTEDETAEFDRPDTIDALERAIQNLGHETDRIGHATELTRRLVDGSQWDLVFNIAEGLHGIGREAQIPGLLDLYGIPYTFSDPLVMSLTLHKGLTKRVIRDAGIPTPDFQVIEKPEDIENITFAPPYFAKPVAEGTSKGATPESIVRNREDLADVCARLADQYHQPVIVERYLPGREFTVGIVGTGQDALALGTIEVHLLSEAEQGVYSYLNKENCEELVEYRLVLKKDDPVVEESERIALHAWRVLGCRDAGRVDVRCDEKGCPQFIEVNPLAGLHPEHSDLPILCNQLGVPYVHLIGQIIESSQKRMKNGNGRRKRSAGSCKSL